MTSSTLLLLSGIRHGELVAAGEAFVEPDEQRLVFGSRARPPEVDRPGRALRRRVVGLRGGGARRDDWTANRVETVVVDAGAEESTWCLVLALPVEKSAWTDISLSS